MSIAVYPGTFDPVTYGHIDMIRRAGAIFDRVIIGVLKNYTKNPLFDLNERMEMLHEVTRGLSNITISTFDGLVVDFCKKEGADVIVRGIRSFSDFEYELTMAHTNRQLKSEADTVFLATSPEYSYVSSSSVRELIAFDGDISAFVPDAIRDRIYKKIRDNR